MPFSKLLETATTGHLHSKECIHALTLLGMAPHGRMSDEVRARCEEAGIPLSKDCLMQPAQDEAA